MLQWIEFEKIKWKFELIWVQIDTPTVYQFKRKYNVKYDF